MHYWKTKDLASSIKDGSIDKVEAKNYYIAVSIIGFLGMYIAISEGTTNLIATSVECVFLVIITVIGINITFKTNQGAEGDDYIARIVILSLPILIKLYVLALIIGFAFGVAIGASFVMGINGGTESDLGQWPFVILSIIVQTIYFWRLNTHLRYINT
jgi:hypothetical protein